MKKLDDKKTHKQKEKETLKENLDKILQMQKELSIFLKVTNNKQKTGVEFLEEVKDIDEDEVFNNLKEKVMRDFENEDFNFNFNKEEKNESNNQQNETLSLKAIRDILFKVNKKVIKKQNQII